MQRGEFATTGNYGRFLFSLFFFPFLIMLCIFVVVIILRGNEATGFGISLIDAPLFFIGLSDDQTNQKNALATVFVLGMSLLGAVGGSLHVISAYRIFRSKPRPIRVKDGRLFIWGKDRHSLSDFDGFLVEKHGRHGYLTGSLTNGRKIKLMHTSMVREDSEWVCQELNARI
jgi:hypothetical protein